MLPFLNYIVLYFKSSNCLMKRYLPLFLMCFGTFLSAQENVKETAEQELTAKVVNAQTDFPLESVHVINLNKIVGTITDREGEFKIAASVNDTLYLTYLGFKPQKIIK